MRNAIRKFNERRTHRNPYTRWLWIPIEAILAEKVIAVAVLAIIVIAWVTL